jgi:hypothetical protein
MYLFETTTKIIIIVHFKINNMEYQKNIDNWYDD